MAEYVLDIKSTTTYQSVEETQQAALQALAAAIARAVRAGLDSGRYVVEDGVVIPTDSPTIAHRRN